MAKEKTTATTTPAVNETTTTPAPAKIVVDPTNPKIDELRVKKIELQKQERTFDVGTKESDDLNIEIWKIGEAIKSEIANMKKEQAEADKKAAQSAKLQLLVNHDNARDAAKNDPDNVTLQDAAKTAREIVENIILGSVRSTTTGTKTTPSENGSKGSTTAAIRAFARPLMDGQTRETYEASGIGKAIRKQLLDQDFNDGTMNAAVLNLERELGLKD